MLLTYINPAYLRSGVGLLLVIYGACGLAQPKLKSVPASVPADAGVGFANGILAGLTGHRRTDLGGAFCGSRSQCAWPILTFRPGKARYGRKRDKGSAEHDDRRRTRARR
jgi:hypothetical protein